ncbi:restriction endonuclease subunit S [Burkholderia cepacia]|uniref:restriction endonuclease subunit S n=1 Tax=Burkholderia cepacia TaxID=292 RepID=UPI0018C478DB|nr:restriction endonuclease subunit S [Burkholderia cepacia]
MNKLLDGVTVEWKALGTVIKTITAPAKLKSESYRTTGRLPIVDQGIEFIAGYTDEDVTPVEAGEYVIFGDHSEHIKYVDFPFIQGADGLKILRPISANAKYIYHAFLNFYTKELNYKRHWLTAQQTLIPIPCPENPKKSLEIQAKIVRILDAFTELTAELTTELTVRKKQYNYYRDQLLSFEDDEVEWQTLGGLAENLDSMRKPITSGLRESGDIPYYGASGIVDHVKDYIFDCDLLLVSEDGANLLARNTPIAFSIGGKSWVNNHAHVLKFKTYAERKYVEYYLNSIDLTSYISGAAQPKLNKKSLESIRIPNPSPEDKKRIVEILDKFDALVGSISDGLPREIELRQKQYEHYRNLLLNFPKPKATGA